MSSAPRTKLDATRIAQMSFDASSFAQRVKVVDSEFNLQLNHESGDSITSHPAKLIAVVSGVERTDDNKEIIPPLDCSSLSQIRVDINGSGSVKVWASPSDSGSFFYLVGDAGIVHNICARRINVVSVDACGEVYLVGKS